MRQPITSSSAISICLLLASIKQNMAQNPFYGNQTPPPYNDDSDSRNQNDQNNSNRYDRYNTDTTSRYDQNNRYDPNSRYNNDLNNRYNDSNSRYGSYDRYNNSNRYNDSNNRYNDPYNNRYNDSSNRYDPSNRYNDPNNRYNDPNNRYNDPNNRYNESGNRYNDPYNRNNDSGNRYNDPNNRRYDPNSRYNNQDQYNRYNSSNPYNSGSDLNPNYRNNDRYNTDNRYNNSNQYPYNQDPNNRNQYNQYNRNNDPNNRYNQQNQYNQNNRYNQGYSNNNSNGQYNQQNRQYDSGFGNPGGSQFGANNDPNDNCCEDYCYRTDENPSLHFGSKTAYEIVYGRRASQDVPECSPVQIWSINRHGTRFPTDQEIRRLRGLTNLREEILKNYGERRSHPYKGKMCDGDIDLLRKWRWNDTLSEAREKVLTSQGIEDAKFLARRFKSKFSNLLNQPYRENYYNFQYDTSDYKTHDTYQAYIEGLFDINKSFNVHANTDLSERILPPGYCKTWSREVENNNNTYYEYERFKQRQEYLQMLRDIFKRLGFRYTLNEAMIRDMYDMCRYEKAWYLNDPSPWCSVFTKSQLEMLEYAEDLQDYYYSGYGNEANARVGCLLVKDMYEMMKKTVDGYSGDAYKVSHYFTHSTQFLRFLTAMGVARDNSPLTADNYYQQKNRQWKLSTIDPFSANFMAVLYNCQRENKHKVLFLLNEAPVNFPECSVGLCDWSTVEQRIKSVADNCNKEYCERGSSANALTLHFLPALALVLSLFYLF